MKFGKQLEEYELAEWKGHYIPYKELKRGLEKIKHVNPTPPTTPQGGRKGQLNGTGNQDPLLERQESFDRSGDAVQGTLLAAFSELPTEAEQVKVWMRYLDKEAMRVGDFVGRGLDGLEAQLADLEKVGQRLAQRREEKNRSPGSGRSSDFTGAGGVRDGSGRLKVVEEGRGESHNGDILPNSLCRRPSVLEAFYQRWWVEADSEADNAEPGSTEEDYLELRMLDSVGRVAEGARRLQQFAELNHAALYKILKKHDKLLGSKEGLAKFPTLVEETKLGDKSRSECLQLQLQELSLRSTQLEGLGVEASAEVARLASGLGAGQTQQGGASRAEMALCFFLGTTFALFLALGLLIMLPGTKPHSSSLPYFLTPMPVFRVVFSFVLSLWCLGAVARTCEQYDINHNFILNVDPRCHVTPNFFFVRAAVLTTMFILIFGMYIVDYKWELCPGWSHHWFNYYGPQRSAAHFVLYPVSLLCITFLGMIWPSRVCRNRYKMSLVRAMGRTFLAPLFPVYFQDNMIGDVLTSLAKPLQDVPAALCYFASPHPQQWVYIDRFTAKGDTCGFYTHHVLLPFIGGLPYMFRAMQCLRRYHDTKETRNLWNFGKYVASLMVVVASSAFHEHTVLIFIVSAIATVYAFAWDVLLDWGLGRKEMWPRKAGKKMPSEDLCRSLSPAPSPGTQVSGSPMRSPPELQERHLTWQVYWTCSVVDVLARSTWVLTLMPITIISSSIIGRTLLVSVISSIEILRRSMWAVLRIENEQVNNAGGFRALHWVPAKLHVAHRQPRGRTKESLAALHL